MGEMREGIFWTHHIKAHGFDPETPIQAELDIMKEKAEALGRVGGRLDESLRGMKILEKRIQMLEREGQRGRVAVNTLIGEFNQVRQRPCDTFTTLSFSGRPWGFADTRTSRRCIRFLPARDPFR